MLVSGAGAVSKGKQGLRARVALGLCLMVGLFGIAAVPADASYTPRSAVMYSGPSYYYKAVAMTLAGWYVRMNCWIDTPYWSYGTNRWFNISAYAWNPYTGRGGYFSGFVSANQVAEQTRVGHC